jgi:hypothetical protein
MQRADDLRAFLGGDVVETTGVTAELEGLALGEVRLGEEESAESKE